MYNCLAFLHLFIPAEVKAPGNGIKHAFIYKGKISYKMDATVSKIYIHIQDILS